MKYSLSLFSLFSPLLDEERANIEDFCQEKTLAAGEYLFQEGDEPQAMYIAASGSFSVVQGDQKKELAVLHPGDLIGEMAFFGSESTRNASVLAREESEVIVLLMFSLTEIFTKYPLLKDKLTELVEARGKLNSEEPLG